MTNHKDGQTHGKEEMKNPANQQMKTGQSHPDSHTQNKGHQVPLEAHKLPESFKGIDFYKVDEFAKRLESDEILKEQYVADPATTLKNEKIALPRGVIATYDDQYLKNPDGTDQNRYCLRIGYVKLSM